MVIQRREIWWAVLEAPRGSEPGFRQPVLILQAEAFNRSRLRTVLVAILTSNLRLADAPGNVRVSAADTGLPRDSVVNVTQLLILDRDYLRDSVGRLPGSIMARVDAGLKLVLELE